MEAILYDSRDVEDLAYADWEELDESERSDEKWKQLLEEAMEDIRYEFDDLKDTLIKGMPEGDEILLVKRDATNSLLMDGSQYELCRPEDALGDWRDLCVYYEGGHIWLQRVNGLYITSDCKALWVPEQTWDSEEPEEEYRWDFIRSVERRRLDDPCELEEGIEMYTQSLAYVFRNALEWNGVHVSPPEPPMVYLSDDGEEE